MEAVGVVERSALTERLRVRLPVRDGAVEPDPERDVARLAVVERHRGSGRLANGFVVGLGLRRGAVASTVAHDSHNLIVAGVEPEDMALAAEVVAERQGGIVAVAAGQVLAFVPLPVAGLMADLPLGRLKAAVDALTEAFKSLGSHLHAPHMALSLLALPVIPELRLTNRGLVDVMAGRLVPVEVGLPDG